ncbi:zinc metallochaperone AztD [Kineococcus gypseus]|uniref:zinc metallochaperone AztD n=1 Tax=Kineococcus gypseus TaxID=1637102 RepID=UPI003D7E6553
MPLLAPHPRRSTALTALTATLSAACLAAVTACSSGDGSATPAAAQSPSGSVSRTPAPATEAAASQPRLAVTYDGGVQILDANSLELLADLPFEGFARVNPAGDGRRVFVTATGGWHVVDAGAWEEPHGDHGHYYTTEPSDTGIVFEAEEAGHVVNHAGRTVLFDDGTGEIVSFDSDEVADPDREVREMSTPSAHHGVAVELSDGSTIVTEGTEESRDGIRLLDASGTEVAASTDCPNVHGETVAADEVVVVGCTDGVLVVEDGRITKIDSPDEYGRIGNQWGLDDSPIVVGDYRAEQDTPTDAVGRISLIDTATNQLRLVQLPASYWYRSLGRGEDGEAVVLGTDGALHVVDTAGAAVTRSVPVIAPWQVQEDWQAPQPQVFTTEGTAYVTEPATNSVHAVDIATGEVWRSAALSVTPNELTGVTGAADEHGHEGEREGEHEGEHEGKHEETRS